MFSQRILLQVFVGLIWVSLICLLLGRCSKSAPDGAIEALYHENYAFTVNDFFKAAGAGDESAVRWFLDAGMAADVDDGQGGRALREAAATGSSGTVGALLEHGANPNEGGEKNRTALILAARSGDAETVRLLLAADADPLAKDVSGWSSLTIAARHGHTRAVEMLAPVSPPFADEALLVACLGGHTAIIDVLLMNRADIHARGSNSFTPLMVAASQGHESAVRLLLDREADRFALDSRELTAAQIAKIAGHDDIATLLSAQPNSAEISGRTEDPLALRDENGRALGQIGRSGGRTPLDGATVIGATLEQLHMENYRERRMPVILNSVDDSGSEAEVRLLFGSHGNIRAAVGEEISDSGLHIVSMRHRVTNGKEGPRDASEIVVRDRTTGEQHRITSGQSARSIGTYALLNVDGMGELYEAHRGDEFTIVEGQGDSEEARCRVLDVRPGQVLVENLDTGEVRTLTRGGATHRSQ